MADFLSLPDGIGVILLAGPAIGIGAAVWWGMIERRETYTYTLGVIFGLVTGIATVLFWLLVFVRSWGLLGVRVAWVVIAFVLLVTLLVGPLAAMPLMDIRRRFGDWPPAVGG